MERIFASEDDGEFEREPDRGSDEGEVRSEDDGTVRGFRHRDGSGDDGDIWESDDEEDLEDGGRDGPVRKGGSKRTAPPRMIMTLLVVGIMITATLGFILLIRSGRDDGNVGDPFDSIGSDEVSSLSGQLMLSEMMPAEEWFEIYVKSWAAGPIENLGFSTFDEEIVPLPSITGADGFDHIIVHTGKGVDDTDLSDGKASVYLDMSGDVLGDEGDELALFDGSERIIDFVGWGDGNGDTPRDGWSGTNYLPAPRDGDSLSLQGDDEDADSFWTEGPPSPLGNSIFTVDLSPEDDWTAYIQNGRTEAIPVILNTSEMRYININVSTGVPPGHPVNKTKLDEVAEYLNYTYNLLKKMGFGSALASGTDSNGKPFIKISVTRNGTYSGTCSSSGEISVDIGSNKVASKQTVEHEMTHNFQFSARSDGSTHINPWSSNFIDEGTAEFIGRYSAMLNYNKTWKEVEDELQSAGSLNIYDYFHRAWYDIFTDWPGAYKNGTYVHSGNYYAGSFLFMKFLMDKFGISVISKIYNATVNKPGTSHDVVGIDAVEKATGTKFEDLLSEFNLYRLENRFPQYRNNPKFKNTTMDSEHDFNGTGSISDNERVEQYGSRINRYNLHGSSALITFVPDSNRSRWQLTVIRIGSDGKRTYEKITIEKGDDGLIYIPEGYEQVIIIKTRLNGSLKFFEGFNITIKQAPVITPMGPVNNDHIMWDPPLFINWTLLENTINASVRVQISNSSTFIDPWIDEILWDPDPEWSFPFRPANGTHWWRLRWEKDDKAGPWVGPWNFTYWNGMPPPDIMWDPAPVRFVNESGDWGIILPDTTVMIREYDIPSGVEVEEGHPEFRLSGKDIPSVLFNWTFGVPFPVGEHMEPGYDTFEWRVHYTPFDDWPWFSDDILWDPAPPRIEVIPPIPDRRQREDTTIQIGSNDTFHVDSFFDIYYDLDLPDTPKMKYESGPRFNRSEGEMIIYDLDLNFSELPEVNVTFEIVLRDVHGRSSNTLLLDFEIDRSAPSFEIGTDPIREPAVFNRSFEVTVLSRDSDTVNVRASIIDGIYFEIMFEIPMSPPIPWEEPSVWKGSVDVVWWDLFDGPWIVRVDVEDDLGNSRHGELPVVIDRTPPTISMLEPAGEIVVPVGSDLPVRVDVTEDQSVLRTMSDVRVILRCMDNLTEALNVRMEWISTSIYEVTITIPDWADPSAAWRLEVLAEDRGGNRGSAFVFVDLT
ncbi:MAG: hypothetical protein DRN57_04050 [Thermoplasmata archaeon]|nr:MAG: hypothetical protein DRN57_04050 [Thermoplasmata archaeon]